MGWIEVIHQHIRDSKSVLFPNIFFFAFQVEHIPVSDSYENIVQIEKKKKLTCLGISQVNGMGRRGDARQTQQLSCRSAPRTRMQ
jgi:hypothetical protein